MKKNFLPISIDIAGERILIIGGGKSAFKKLQILKRFNAEVDVLAEEVCDAIKQTGVKYFENRYSGEYLRGYLLVYSCTNDPVTDRQIVIDGKREGILVNIHDQPLLCRFVSPAIFRHGKMTVSVGSNGEDVFESIRMRNRIGEFLTDENRKINNN